MIDHAPVVLWFRQDLRLADNPALAAAVASGAPILPVYILDDINAGPWAMGGASRWWLHQSLQSLNAALDGRLRFFSGDAAELMPEIMAGIGAQGVYWNRCYEPWRIERDRKLKSSLRDLGLAAHSFNSALLFEPQSIAKADGTPYRVFTPFYRKGCLGAPPPHHAEPPPEYIELCASDAGADLDSLQLEPTIDWADGLAAEWSPGEQGAEARLATFIEQGLADYAEGRNRPDQAIVSRLSPHLHFGEISPHRVWHAIRDAVGDPDSHEGADRFLAELGWREFSYYLLYHCPQLPDTNLQSRFDAFDWRDDPDTLARWQQGMTGYPIVDAGMRELWRTGYMHNRVRMVVGSFLVKNLLIDWRHGEAWFRDTLVDADLASNSASWQWVAGCGADAAPYFRIFNPVTQGKKFDPDGDYVRRHVPELAKLPAKFIHCPWEAPEDVLEEAGVEPGVDYPTPIVDLKASRQRALDAFQQLKKR